MNLNTLIKTSCRLCLRKYSKSASKSKPVVVPDSNVLKDISGDVYKPRKHPGIMLNRCITIPDTLVKAVWNTSKDYPVKALLADGKNLERHLNGKVPPMEEGELKEVIKKVHGRVLKKYNDIVINTEEDAKRLNQSIKNKVDNILSEKVYNWKPMKYDVYNSLVYLMSRSAAEYAVLVKIFGEIVIRDPEFKPRSFFDFGSGVGTGTWAAHWYWKSNIFEYFNVDSSRDMNDLAEILLQGGTGNGTPMVKGAFFRQFLPASNNEYDLVLSAYSMMELPSLQARLDAILNLWNKTQKYLVIVEQGTNAGFKVVNEARDYILQISKQGSTGHVFSPCPHDQLCPRFLADDGTPCNFEVSYLSMPIGQKSDLRKERFSYVVLQKGNRPQEKVWPRIVRPALVRSKHTVCRLCTANGDLDEIIFTAKKHGKVTYRCARSSSWGDLLPISVEKKENANFDINIVDEAENKPEMEQ